MPATVYVTHGRKYHADATCPRMRGGEYLHDAGWYRREDPSPQYAAMRGKLPCLHCVPAELRAFPPLYGQTFGHHPVEIQGDQFCARCRTPYLDEGEAQTYPTLWPCTSAVVLGLVERDAA